MKSEITVEISIKDIDCFRELINDLMHSYQELPCEVQQSLDRLNDFCKENRIERERVEDERNDK